MNRIPMILIVLLASSAMAIIVQAHGGRSDKQGCHNNRKQGTYHCHRGPLAGQTFASKADAQAALSQSRPAQKPAPPKKASVPPAEAVGSFPYDRDLYGGWIDADGDCQDTRAEVLIVESQVPVTLDARGCEVVAGRWFDPYTGRHFTNPRSLDIDHFIPLAEVHRSGGATWTPSQRKEYANDLIDPRTLIAVSASANRSKGGKDPADWLPPNQNFHCEYVELWLAIKQVWALVMDAREESAIKAVLDRCR